MISRQFAAAIEMLRSAIEACPDNLWDDRADGTPFWHLAYHALFYTDFYLSHDAESFQARDFHVEKANHLPGDYPPNLGVVTTPDKAFTKAELLDYADHCLRKSDATFQKLTEKRALERCGFPWYQLNVGEFLLNTLRHTQHHTGQLTVLLRRRANAGIRWLGTKGNQPPPPTW
ncbi:MAG TPA: DinB family protein [Bryobacteraceae bacterium]|nr:DinB family protein [Bryobacteraceae bacterium]